MVSHESRCRDGAITKDDLKVLLRQTNSYLEPVALVSSSNCGAARISALYHSRNLCLHYLTFP